ncbi:MAG: ATP-dependent Clp protease proteolytic subunit, partial [Candidatus Kapabacteria bacterium]|nr:ATP-dependent Clp protease proteolytic subunit [Candidatus Kapabacteria bacterium]
MNDSIPHNKHDNTEIESQISSTITATDNQIPNEYSEIRETTHETPESNSAENTNSTNETTFNNDTDNEKKNVLLLESINKVASQENADIFIYQESISQENADEFVEEVRSIKKRQKNVILILTTYGGDPHAAYRIIKCLKRNYEKVVLHVYGYCKSAGTLIALGANEIIMDEFGELGPLDVQLSKKGDIGVSSGLDYFSSLEILTEQALKIYEQMFIEIVTRSGSA